MINPEFLGIYAPKTGEKMILAQEAKQIIGQELYTYKQLFYGLRALAWQERNKKAIFTEAWEAGELNQFKIAPGRRTSNGFYSKDEWDYDSLNLYLWQRFAERFEDAFNLENVSTLKTYKDIKTCTEMLLTFALENYGEKFLGDLLLDEEDDPKAHRENLNLMKELLLEINRNKFEERNLKQQEQTPKTRPINDDVDATPNQKPLSLKEQRDLEAQQFLNDHPEFDPDSDAPF
jgi:hypothetical protein